MKKHLPFYLLSLLSLLVFVLLQMYDPVFIRDQIESKTFDIRLNLRNLFGKQPSTSNIGIVVIDEKSIAEIGRWPWSRTVQAQLVDKIASGKPKAIGIDIMYSETESAKADKTLANAIKRAGNVVQATAFITETDEERKEETTPPPEYLWDAAFMEVKSVPGIDWKSWAVKPVRVNPPVEPVAKAATLGHVANMPDMDGVLRWDIMYVNFGDDCYPSLPLQVARVASRIAPKDMILYGGSGVQLGEHFIKTDISGRVIINYRGKEKSFQHISASDLLKGRVSLELLKDRIILVGTSALATFDQKVTPFSANFPGVEKNANVVHNILNNDFITKSHGVAELAVIIITALILIIFLPRLKAIPGVILGFGLMVAYFFLSIYLMVLYDIWIYFVTPTANMVVIVTVGTITKLFSEEKQSRQIRAMFSSYVTERLVNEMIKNPEMARLGGEKREITVLFSDVKGFTTYSENHAPEEVVAILNEYLGEMTRIILKWEGILDKFIGDAIVVFWGAPLKQEDHAERAVKCALEMQARLGELKTVWEASGREPLSSGIGINTGEAIVGNIGAEGQKMDYTVIGDHVNLGARVEGLTRRYDASILATEYTVDRLRSSIAQGTIKGLAINGVERVIVKGKEKPVGIFTITPLAVGSAAHLTECDPEKVVRLTEK
ncbi:MAG: adenylate/guanylate cyclase domain-containing protein [Geobacteraceae bacterium]|nr:adenylate/guanylate cyclase domain-containing protein [Geobacteraceae bacterium]